MWQPDTWPMVYAIASRARPKANATPRVPITLDARMALPGPISIRTAVPMVSATAIRMMEGDVAVAGATAVMERVPFVAGGPRLAGWSPGGGYGRRPSPPAIPFMREPG